MQPEMESATNVESESKAEKESRLKAFFLRRKFLVSCITGLSVCLLLGWWLIIRTALPDEFQTSQEFPADHLTALLFDKTGEQFYAATDSGYVYQWAFPAGEIKKLEWLSSYPLTSLALSADGFLVAGGNRREILGWQVSGDETKKVAHRITDIAGSVSSITFRPNSLELITGTSNGKLCYLSPVKPAVLDVGKESVKALACSPDGRNTVLGTDDGKIEWWENRTRKMVKPAHSAEVSQIRFSTDGKTLVSSDWNGQLTLWDVASRTILNSWSQPDSVSDVVWKGDTLITGSWDGHIRLWSSTSQQLTGEFNTQKPVLRLALHPEGQTLAVINGGNSVTLWTLP